jgi:hypothetical protein
MVHQILQYMEVVAAGVPAVLVRTELVLLVVMVDLEFNFHQHLEIQYLLQLQLVVVWVCQAHQVLIGLLVAVVAEHSPVVLVVLEVDQELHNCLNPEQLDMVGLVLDLAELEQHLVEMR